MSTETETEAPVPSAEEVVRLTQLVLRSIVDQRLDHVSLRQLPGMHAVLLARVAWKARVMTRADLDKLVHEATYGPLKPYKEPRGVRVRVDANRDGAAG